MNEGSNLFVTGIHPRLTEEEITVLFEKHGRVEKCNIMRDPHTRESRGFGFVKMVGSEDADAAKDALQGEVYEGRTLSIEKARRARPRTPTPGKYFGPPKREDRPARGGGGGYRDRFDVSIDNKSLCYFERVTDHIAGPWTSQALRRPSRRWTPRPLRGMLNHKTLLTKPD
jgi:RNA recognition motif-containing protein